MTEAEENPYDTLRNFRTTERAQMIGAIRELIESSEESGVENTLSRDGTKCMKLAGQLISYEDQILRSASYEALEKDVAALKKMVLEAIQGAHNLAHHLHPSSVEERFEDPESHTRDSEPKTCAPLPQERNGHQRPILPKDVFVKPRLPGRFLRSKASAYHNSCTRA